MNSLSNRQAVAEISRQSGYDNFPGPRLRLPPAKIGDNIRQLRGLVGARGMSMRIGKGHYRVAKPSQIIDLMGGAAEAGDYASLSWLRSVLKWGRLTADREVPGRVLINKGQVDHARRLVGKSTKPL